MFARQKSTVDHSSAIIMYLTTCYKQIEEHRRQQLSKYHKYKYKHKYKHKFGYLK